MSNVSGTRSSETATPFTRVIDHLRRPAGGGRFVPEIDGLRFFAIFPVVLDHAWWSYRTNVGDPGFNLDSTLGRVFSAGELGVQLFFVISGYVLGLGKKREWDRSNTLSRAEA